MRYDLLCIGSGPAGQRGAVQAAKLGRRAVIVERGAVGGVCTGTGTIPSKTFREAVRTFVAGQGAPRASARPSAADLLARVGQVIDREESVISNQLARNGVDIVQGRASFVDPHTVLVQSPNGTLQIEAENILIATGTTPAPPPGATPDGETVLTSDDIGGMKRLPMSL